MKLSRLAGLTALAGAINASDADAGQLANRMELPAGDYPEMNSDDIANKYSGTGELNTFSFKYRGEFVDGKFDGAGDLQTKNDMRVIGEFKNDVPDGPCVFTDSSNEDFLVEFDDGSAVFEKNGRIYEIEWRHYELIVSSASSGEIAEITAKNVQDVLNGIDVLAGGDIEVPNGNVALPTAEEVAKRAKKFVKKEDANDESEGLNDSGARIDDVDENDEPEGLNDSGARIDDVDEGSEDVDRMENLLPIGERLYIELGDSQLPSSEEVLDRAYSVGGAREDSVDSESVLNDDVEVPSDDAEFIDNFAEYIRQTAEYLDATMDSIEGLADEINQPIDPEYFRLEGELASALAWGKWKKVDSVYKKILKLDDFNLSMIDSDVFVEISRAYMQLGDMQSAYDCLKTGLEAKRGVDAGILNELTYIEENFSKVDLSISKHFQGVVLAVKYPFDPIQVAVIKFAQDKLETDEQFVGYLPVGEYLLGTRIIEVKQFMSDPVKIHVK